MCDNLCVISLLTGIIVRIFSNSGLNVFQKLLTERGGHSSVVNFYTYFGLSLISLVMLPFLSIQMSADLVLNFICMGLLGALGNYFIIKALSKGELSSLAPINSYKPIVALIIGFLYLKEVPSYAAVLGICLIIFGTFIMYSQKLITNNEAVLYRIYALIFSGTEAVFIKKVLLLTGVAESFVLWSFAGLLFSSFFILISKKPLKIVSIKYQLLLVLSVAFMQYSTNFVFSKINVAYALAIFQLSTILSVFLGISIFDEKNLMRKICASCIMVAGAVLILLF